MNFKNLFTFYDFKKWLIVIIAICYVWNFIRLNNVYLYFNSIWLFVKKYIVQQFIQTLSNL